MENEHELPAKEREYWDREISTRELEELAASGECLWNNPRFLEHRISHILWNKRIKRQYRNPR